MIKIGLKNSLYPLSHFTKYLVGVFRKSPWDCNLDREFSSLLNPVAQEHCGVHLQPSTLNREIENSSHTRTRTEELRTLDKHRRNAQS
jgi:hypothetical protein